MEQDVFVVFENKTGHEQLLQLRVRGQFQDVLLFLALLNKIIFLLLLLFLGFNFTLDVE